MSARFDGLTAKQDQVLGLIAIGCDIGHPPATLAVLLKRGLIVRLPDREVGRDRFGSICVPQYEMPLHEHMRWCQWCADNVPIPDADPSPHQPSGQRSAP